MPMIMSHQQPITYNTSGSSMKKLTITQVAFTDEGFA